jgi:hypothetical protein
MTPIRLNLTVASILATAFSTAFLIATIPVSAFGGLAA